MRLETRMFYMFDRMRSLCLSRLNNTSAICLYTRWRKLIKTVAKPLLFTSLIRIFFLRRCCGSMRFYDGTAIGNSFFFFVFMPFALWSKLLAIRLYIAKGYMCASQMLSFFCFCYVLFIFPLLVAVAF